MELVALAKRIQYMEMSAERVNASLPDTPGELNTVASPLLKTTEPQNDSSNNTATPAKIRMERPPSVSTRTKRIGNLLAARDTFGTADAERSVSEEDISLLRDHVERQADEIRSQRVVISEIRQGLQQSEQQAREAFLRVENDEVGLLERELHKHQQANEAFQKALREIGGIITSVANGDLSSRVQIQATELDTEIINFKVTINNMMDQLEKFGSEVTRVAREVGTEGVLGGQARITGVRGIWKELTDNGKSDYALVLSEYLTIFSQYYGNQFDRSGQRNCDCHKSSGKW